MQFERSMIGAVDDSEIVMFARARLGKPQSAQCLQHELCECVLIDGPGIEQDPGIGDLLGRRFPGRMQDSASDFERSMDACCWFAMPVPRHRA
jgi:hypothetical protein